MADITEARLDQLLESFRADVPEPSTQTFDDLRADLLAATVMPEIRPLAPDAVRPLRPTTPRARRRALAGLLGAAAVVAALAVGAVGAVVVLPHHGDVPAAAHRAPKTKGLPPMPSKPVNRTGELAAHVTMPTLEKGQYLYIREVYTQFPIEGNPGGIRTNELWITYDLSDNWRNYSTSTGRPQAGTENNAPEDTRGPSSKIDSGGMASAMRKLPTDPAKLYQLLAKKYEHDPDATAKAVSSLLGNLYVDYYIPPAQKAAMYTVLGYLPGVQVTRTTLPDHTEVTVLTQLTDGLRAQIFIDPRDGRMAGYRNVAAVDQNGVKAGSVRTVSYVTQSVVDSIETRP